VAVHGGMSAVVGVGPQGHRTVGAIAERLLTPQAQAVLNQLLSAGLDKFGNPSGRTTLAAVSVWADELNGTPAARPAWHYDDVPICGSAPQSQYCPGGQCNSGQLPRLMALLADPRTPPRERNESLKWVVHLVADLHQPLHAADNNDRGGNRVQVALGGVRTRGRQNLHRVWDNELVQLTLRTRGHQQPPADIGVFAAEARRMAAAVGQGTPDSWARESNNLARNLAYRYPGFACGRVPPGIVVLDGDYQDSAELVVRKRLCWRGHAWRAC
jgi:hypothetical protein